jgi:diacylglycerol kinase (ATP)
MLVSIANGPTYGGGMKIVPDADRTDGYLDIMILAEVSKFELLRVFPKVFSGGHKNHPAVSFHRTKTFSLQAAALAYADGEFIGDLPIHGEIHANALLTWDIR